MSPINRRAFLRVNGAVLGGIAVGTTVTAATSIDRFVVETATAEPPSELTVVHPLPGIEFAVVRGTESEVDAASDVKNAVPDIRVHLDEPGVNEAAPRVALKGQSIVDEPYYPYQWDKQALDIETAHHTTTGAGSRVTVIDSGVAAGHPDLTVNEGLSRNFTGDGLGAANPAGGYHGTHVGGIIAADTHEDIGVGGTAPDTDLVDCRVFSPGGGAAFGDILAAIVYSANIDADVANLSLGAYPVPRQGLGSFYGKALNAIMTYANAAGTLLVVAAGNDAADLQHDKYFISLPNEGAQAVSVAATGPIGFRHGDPGLTDPVETPALYTNYGTNAITLAAPGGNYDPAFPDLWYYDLVFNCIAEPKYRTDRDGDVVDITKVDYGYAWVSGTSMAAPQVSGAAALVKSANPGANANDVESALKEAATVPDGFDKRYYGSGFLDVVDAL